MPIFSQLIHQQFSSVLKAGRTLTVFGLVVQCFLSLVKENTSLAAESTSSPPNIVFILSDDMGWAEPGFNGGNPKLTPNIDALASQGVQLTQFYTHSVCAPTRGALLTGRYAFRTWMDWRSEDFGKPSYLAKLGMKLAHNEKGEPTRMIHALDSSEQTIAEILKDRGYFTAIAGKWHCGEWLPEHLPMGQGFLHQYGHYAWGIDYNNYTIPHNAPARFAVYDWHRNQKPIWEQGYTTDLIANEVVRLISQQSSEKPFFVYAAFNAVHGPIEEVPRYTDEYPARQAALKCFDDALGRIVGAVDQFGFKENTLVIFANDNGGLTEEMNKPLRGTKNTTFEGGVRVPCVMRFPGKIEAGTKNNGLMHVTDLLPTFAQLAGSDKASQGPYPIDGMDMNGMLFERRPSPRNEIIFEVEGSVRLPTIRSGRFKLMGEMLYDLEADPGEKVDVAADNPDVVSKLKARLVEAGKQRPPLDKDLELMDPALPYVYGQAENEAAPSWLVEHMKRIRATQPQSWAPGTTPWPQAPKGATMTYTGDGR